MGLWFYYEFRNDQGSEYRVEIHDQNGSPTQTEVKPDAKGFQIKYDGKEDDVFFPILGSKCSFTILNNPDYESEIDDFLTDLRQNDEGRFVVAIYRDPDGDNALFWTGTILPDQTEAEDMAAEASQNISIVAADDLANLKNIDYTDDGTAYTGVDSLAFHVVKCLEKTRTTAFWDTDDVFIRFGNMFKTQSQAVVTQPTSSFIGFSHEELYDTDSFGLTVYPSAYDVLYQICQTFMLTICMTDGAWTMIPRHRFAYTTQPGYTTFKKSGLKISNNVTMGTGYTISSDPTDSTKPRRLTGFSFPYIHAARVVKREYEFSGNIPVIAINEIDETDLGYATTYPSPGNYIVPSGVALRFESVINLTQDGEGTRTGDERVIKYLVSIKLKCGSYYFDRPWTLTTNQVDPFNLTDGTQVLTFLEYGGAQGSWNTDNSKRYEFMLPAVDAENGQTLPVMNLNWTTTGLPVDSSGVEVEFDVTAYHADGTTSALITSTALSEATFTINQFQVFIGDLQGGDTLFFRAEADNDARDVVELEKALLGDNLGDTASRGSLRYMSDDSYTTNTWHQIGQTDYNYINTQICKQHLYQRRKTTRLVRGTVFFTDFYLYDWLSYESVQYIVYSMTYRAGQSEYDIEAFEVKYDTGDITAPDPERNDGQPGTSPYTPVGVGFAVGGDAMGQALGAAQESINEVQPAGTGGLSVRENSGDTESVSLTSTTLTSDRTVTLPDADVDFTGGSTGYVLTQQSDGSFAPAAASGGESIVLIYASANVGNTGQNRYIPLKGYFIDTSSIQIYTEALMPFDGEWKDLAIQCQNNPGTGTIRIWKNGTEQDSAVMSGTEDTLDFSGNTFAAGDKLAVSLHITSAAGNVWVGIKLVIS